MCLIALPETCASSIPDGKHLGYKHLIIYRTFPMFDLSAPRSQGYPRSTRHRRNNYTGCAHLSRTSSTLIIAKPFVARTLSWLHPGYIASTEKAADLASVLHTSYITAPSALRSLTLLLRRVENSRRGPHTGPVPAVCVPAAEPQISQVVWSHTLVL